MASTIATTLRSLADLAELLERGVCRVCARKIADEDQRDDSQREEANKGSATRPVSAETSANFREEQKQIKERGGQQQENKSKIDIKYHDTTLNDVRFIDCDMQNVVFKNCQLNNVLFTGCEFESVVIEDLNMKDVHLHNILLDSVRMRKALMHGILWQNMRVEHVILDPRTLVLTETQRHVKLSGLHLERSYASWLAKLQGISYSFKPSSKAVWMSEINLVKTTKKERHLMDFPQDILKRIIAYCFPPVAVVMHEKALATAGSAAKGRISFIGYKRKTHPTVRSMYIGKFSNGDGKVMALQ